MILLGILIVLLLGAYLLMPGKRRTAIAQSVAAPIQHAMQPYVSQRERDIIEDAQAVAADYEQAARAELRQAALDRHRQQLNVAQAHNVAMANVISQFGPGASIANASAKGKQTA